MPKRHFTSTAFVVHQGRTLLHWHAKLQQWMPPGGHIEADEDPVTAAVREVLEETGLRVEILSVARSFAFEEPAQIEPPVTILIETITDGQHEHIDLIYFSRPLDGEAERPLPTDDSWTWVGAEQIERGESLPYDGGSAPVPEDVAVLALAAIRAERGE